MKSQKLLLAFFLYFFLLLGEVEGQRRNRVQARSVLAQDDEFDVNEDSSPNCFDVLANDLSSKGVLVPLTLSLTSAPLQGSASIELFPNSSDPLVCYQPDRDFFGDDSFSYEICDNAQECGSATITIHVKWINDLPYLSDDYGVVADYELSITLNVIANDFDVDSTLKLSSLAIVNPPLHGKAIITDDYQIQYTPDVTYSGGDRLEYELCDTDGGCSTSWVVLYVEDKCISCQKCDDNLAGFTYHTQTVLQIFQTIVGQTSRGSLKRDNIIEMKMMKSNSQVPLISLPLVN